MEVDHVQKAVCHRKSFLRSLTTYANHLTNYQDTAVISPPSCWCRT